MFQLIAHYFILIVYQPFLNLLVFFYWLMDTLIGHADMGWSVILLTIVIRVLLLPLSIAANHSEPERRKISEQMMALEKAAGHDPIKFAREKKLVMKANRRILISESITLTIQVIIAIMLWKIFATGLSGDDLHLIYNIMPDVTLPFNLTFLGKFDLTHTSFTLNLIQSIMIFAYETMISLNSPYKSSRDDVVRMQLILPVVSFVVFMGLPAGKKLFVITSIGFSICFMLYKIIARKIKEWQSGGTDEVTTITPESTAP